MKARTALYLLAFILLAHGQAVAAPGRKTKYTNLKAQAVGEILDMLNTEKDLKDEKEATAAKKTEEDAQLDALGSHYYPTISPVKVAPRKVAAPKKEAYQPNRVNRSGGLGSVGGLGKVGSNNLKAY